MRLAMSGTFRVLIAGWLTTAAIPILAQDIVIDSGSDETVISRLPNAGVEEEPVCSDTATGRLGNCAPVAGLSLLGVYAVGDVFDTTTPNSSETVDVECDTGDTAIAPGYAITAGDIKVFFIAALVDASDHRIRATYVTGSGSSFQFVLQGKCLDFPPAH
jgi:hypothetical protein